MKNKFIKLLSLILILCMLLPLAAACKDDPPPNDDDGDENGEQNGEGTQGETTMKNVNAKLKNTITTKIVDFSDSALAERNAELKSLIGEHEGKPAFKFDTNQYYAISLPSELQIGDNHTVTFDIYNPSKADAIVRFFLKNCSAKVDVVLDFTGWKHFELKIDALSVANPYPNINRLEMSWAEGTVKPTIWVGNFEAHKYEFEVVAPEGVDLNDEKIYKQIVKNYREKVLLGDESCKSLPAYQNQIASVNASCKSAWDSFKATYGNATAQKNFLFNIDMRLGYDGWEYVRWDEEKTYVIYRSITAMAKAYAYDGSEYYQNAELLADIIKALDYCYDVFYGQCIIDKGTVGNWWPWDIGCPKELVDIMVYLENSLTNEQIRHYLKPYDYLLPFPVGSGGNLVDFTISVFVAGALECDAYKIAQAKYLASPLFEYITIDKMGVGADGGIFTDGSFIQHSDTPYTGGYGEIMVTTLPMLVNVVSGTAFSFNEDQIRTMFDWIFDVYRPKMYEGRLMGGHIGRGIGTDEPYKFNNLVRGMIYMLSFCPDDIKPEFKSLVRTFMHQAGKSFENDIALAYSSTAKALYEDESIPLITDYNITRVFGNECRISHHGPEYGISIALSSKRMVKYESINGANFTGWYHADGMIYLYTDGYNHGGQHFYYANPYLMPGTTVNLSERGRGNIYPTIPNASSYAGGVEHGKYGAVGFVLGYDYATTRGTFLEGENAAKITAKKSYFLFDNEVVCIGSEINDYSGKDVVTVVDNRLWGAEDKLFIDGSEITGSALHTHNILTPSTGQSARDQSEYWPCRSHPASALLTADYRKELTGVKTMHFSNMGGYVFLTGEKVSYSKTTIAGDPISGTITEFSANKSQTFLELTIEHGKGDGDVNGRYAYVYLPDATKDETNAYGNAPEVTVFRRNDLAHAVYESKLGIVGAVFFEADGFETPEGAPVSYIESETPCAVMISKNDKGQTVITLSDPTQSYSNIKLSLNISGVSAVAHADAGVDATVSGGTVTVNANVKGSCGSTFSITLN